MSKIKLYISPRLEKKGYSYASIPSEFSGAIEDVGKYFNHAVLLAEVLGFDYKDALISINGAYESISDTSPGFFVEEDFEDLLILFKKIKHRCDELLDKYGRELSGIPNIFVNDYFMLDTLNRVTFKSHSIPLIYFFEKIENIAAMFQYALDNSMSVIYTDGDNFFE